MASGRRGGNSADLRETLMALVRTTLDQVGAVREAAVRQAQTQKTFLDQALLSRRRKDALAALGEEVYSRLLTGELAELAMLPPVAELIAEIAELDEATLDEAAPADDKPADWDRSRARHSSGRPTGARIWRPSAGEAAADADADADADTVEQADEPPTPKRMRNRAATGERVGGIAFVQDEGDEDEDLSAYMHADDVSDD